MLSFSNMLARWLSRYGGPPKNARRLSFRRPGTVKIRPSIEHLEARFVPSTASDIPYVTHGGPVPLALNFDGNPRTDGGPEHDFVVAPYDDGSPGQDQNIQDILFRTSEMYAPFNAEVFRAKWANDYLNGSDGSGPTTVFVGSCFGATNCGAGSTPGQYVDHPMEKNDNTDHVRDSDPFHLAYVDPFQDGPNGTQGNVAQIAHAIAHEAGHTFGLAHVRTDGVTFDNDSGSQPGSITTTPDIMSYDQIATVTDLSYFSTDYLPLCGWNQTNSGLKYQPDSEYPVWDDSNTHIAPTTQDSFLCLGQVLGLRDQGHQWHVADLGAIDWQQAGSYVHPNSDDMDASDSIITEQGAMTRFGDYDVIRWTAPFNETIDVNLTSQDGLRPLLMVYDTNGKLTWRTSGTSRPASSSDLVTQDTGNNLLYIQDSLGGRGQLQVGGAPAGTLAVQQGKSYYFVIGAENGDSTGGYQFTINQLPVWASVNGTTVSIDGNRLGTGASETLTLETSLEGKLQVTLNGALVQFEPGQITAIDVHSLGANNTINVTPGAHSFNSLSSLPKSITIEGGIRAALSIDDSQDLTATTYTLSNLGLTRAAQHEVVVAINYGQLTNLTLVTGSVADIVNVEGTSASTMVIGGGGADTFNIGLANHSMDAVTGPLTLDGGRGGATATVNDSSHVPGLVPTTYIVQSGDISRTDQCWMKVNGHWKIVPVTQTINFSHLSQISLQASDQGENVVNVESTSMPTNVNSGTGTDQVNVTPTSRNLDAIVGALSVSGAPLVVNDQAGAGHSPWGATPVSYLVAANFSRTVRRAPGLPPAVTTIQYSGVNLTVNTSSGPNVVTVTSAGTTTINSGAADAITVTSDALLEGHVIVNAHGGTLTLDDRGLENDEGDLSTDVFTSGYAVTDQGIHHSEREWSRYYVDGSDTPGGKGKWVTTVTNWSAEIDYTNLARLTIDGPAVDTTYGVASTAPGAAVVINGQTGDKPWQPHIPERSTWNHFTMGGKSIHSQVTLNGSGPADTLLVDDSAATTEDTVTVTSTEVGRAARDQFFASGGGLTYSNVPALTLDLSNAYDDVVNLKPSSGTAFTVNGSQAAFQVGHGALLDLDLTDVTSAVNTPDRSEAGKWTFGNRQAVTYSAVARSATTNH
jgi:hypothetical protein